MVNGLGGVEGHEARMAKTGRLFENFFACAEKGHTRPFPANRQSTCQSTPFALGSCHSHANENTYSNLRAHWRIYLLQDLGLPQLHMAEFRELRGVGGIRRNSVPRASPIYRKKETMTAREQFQVTVLELPQVDSEETAVKGAITAKERAK